MSDTTPITALTVDHVAGRGFRITARIGGQTGHTMMTYDGMVGLIGRVTAQMSTECAGKLAAVREWAQRTAANAEGTPAGGRAEDVLEILREPTSSRHWSPNYAKPAALGAAEDLEEWLDSLEKHRAEFEKVYHSMRKSVAGIEAGTKLARIREWAAQARACTGTGPDQRSIAWAGERHRCGIEVLAILDGVAS